MLLCQPSSLLGVQGSVGEEVLPAGLLPILLQAKGGDAAVVVRDALHTLFQRPFYAEGQPHLMQQARSAGDLLYPHSTQQVTMHHPVGP